MRKVFFSSFRVPYETLNKRDISREVPQAVELGGEFDLEKLIDFVQ